MIPVLVPLLVCLGLWSSIFLPVFYFMAFFGLSLMALAISCSCVRAWICIWTLVLFLWACQCECEGHHGILRKAEAATVVNLPGQLPVQVATVNKESGKASEKLLLLWLPGEPGCLSVGAGIASLELGRLSVEKNVPHLRFNEFSRRHFVPQLAEVIFGRNAQRTVKVGNAVMDDEHILNFMIDYAWNHAVISEEDCHRLQHTSNWRTDNQSKI